MLGSRAEAPGPVAPAPTSSALHWQTALGAARPLGHARARAGAARQPAHGRERRRSAEPDLEYPIGRLLPSVADRRRVGSNPADQPGPGSRRGSPQRRPTAAERSRGSAGRSADPAAGGSQAPAGPREPAAAGGRVAGGEPRRALRGTAAGPGRAWCSSLAGSATCSSGSGSSNRSATRTPTWSPRPGPRRPPSRARPTRSRCWSDATVPSPSRSWPSATRWRRSRRRSSTSTSASFALATATPGSLPPSTPTCIRSKRRPRRRRAPPRRPGTRTSAGSPSTRAGWCSPRPARRPRSPR